MKTGGRFDQTMANINLLHKYKDHPAVDLRLISEHVCISEIPLNIGLTILCEVEVALSDSPLTPLLKVT